MDRDGGELDIPALVDAIQRNEIHRIPQKQMELFKETYYSVYKEQPPPRTEGNAGTQTTPAQLGVRSLKRKEMPKIQSEVPKKGRKPNRKLIQEMGAYLIDSGQSATIDSHFHPVQ